MTIPNADNINHIVVFMTGAIPLQDGLAAAVYFSFPEPSAPPMWIFLGYICNQKPSAIFKITKLRQMTANCIEQQNAGMSFALTQPQVMSHVAQIGISIEPQNTVLQLSTDPSVSADSNNLNRFEEFGNRIAEGLFNYCSSFSNNAMFYATNSPNAQLVPVSTITDWYQRFVRNFKANPNFWRQ